MSVGIANMLKMWPAGRSTLWHVEMKNLVWIQLTSGLRLLLTPYSQRPQRTSAFHCLPHRNLRSCHSNHICFLGFESFLTIALIPHCAEISAYFLTSYHRESFCVEGSHPQALLVLFEFYDAKIFLLCFMETNLTATAKSEGFSNRKLLEKPHNLSTELISSRDRI